MLLLAVCAHAAELPHRVRLELGFAHWFGETSGSPDGFTTPEVTVGVQPGLSFLDLQVRYTRSIPALPATHGTTVGVGFLAAGILLQHDLSLGKQAIVVFAGPEGLLYHDAAGAFTIGGGGVIGARYLFSVGIVVRIGPFLSAHEVFYTLPGEDRSLLEDPRREAQIDLGVSVTAF